MAVSSALDDYFCRAQGAARPVLHGLQGLSLKEVVVDEFRAVRENYVPMSIPSRFYHEFQSISQNEAVMKNLLDVGGADYVSRDYLSSAAMEVFGLDRRLVVKSTTDP